MSEALQQEIRHLRTLEGSARDPRDRIFLPLADAHFRLGKFDEAAEMLREGLTRIPDFVAAHVLMGRVLQASGELDEAEETWAAARRLDPQNAEALLSLGRILLGRGEPVGGDLVLKARALDPTAGGQEPDADLVSIAELAPGFTPAPEADVEADGGDVISIASLAPEPVVSAIADAEPSPLPSAPAAAPQAGDRRVVTRTLAELLAAQGQRQRAIDMYEELVERAPLDDGLRARLAELRETGEVDPVEAAEPESDDADLDHRLSRPEPDPDTPTPFTWTGETQAEGSGASARMSGAEPADPPTGAGDTPDEPEPPIADYLAGLLSRSPGFSSGDGSGS